jgi:hypothetical protein
VNESELEYGFLSADEWDDLLELWVELGESPTTLPSPEIARVAGAWRDGKLVGFWVKQLVYHIEPLGIAEGERGRVNWIRLLHMHEQTTKNYFIFAPDEHIAGMCEAAGLTELPWKVYQKGSA